MQISYNWLQQYLPITLHVDELSQILTSIGLEVEGVEKVEKVKGNLEGVVVGEVLTCIPHPNADKLKKTTISIGTDDNLDIVCGAPNVAQGQKVLVATVGTTLYPTDGGSFEIKPAKIRGEVSKGMLCAEDELGLGKGHDGILVLPSDTTVGMKASEYFNFPEPQILIEIGLTPNRSDAMSHIGVARDVCTYLTHHKGQTFEVVMPKIAISNIDNSLLPINITVENVNQCVRYQGVTMRNVNVGPSPEWLTTHLNTIGQKSINNVVDITNYVLHELGQPLHVFDYDKINNNTIIVKNATQGEKFTTLDGKERTLDAADLMICDDLKSLCIAGVMGGQDSGVSENTRNIFIESAYFDPKSIRRTSLRHQLRTDAATHFEKVVNMDYVPLALERAVQLIYELAGGELASPIIDIYNSPLQKKEVSFRYDYISLLCGKEYTTKAIDNILISMGFDMLHQDDIKATVSVPFSKSDINQAADIAEEILRIDGLNNVPLKENIQFSINKSTHNHKRAFKEKICNWLTAQGFNEILTNSIINGNDYPDQPLVRMINSLTTELNAMRPSMLRSGLEVLEYNINRGIKNLMVYEWGNTYIQKAVGDYIQTETLAFWISGNRTNTSWNTSELKHDLYFLKGIIESIFQFTGIKKIKIQYKDNAIHYFIGKELLAVIQTVDTAILKSSGLKQDVMYAEILIAPWLSASENNIIKYSEVNKFPVVERDLSIVLNESIQYAQIEDVIKKCNINSLIGYKLFDIFEGEKLGAGLKAWAINYQFQLKDKTLTDVEVDAEMNKLISMYESTLQATIRK